MNSITVNCKTCSNSFVGKYCNQCGEKVYKEEDKSVLHFAEEGFHFITHFEGTFFTSLRYMFTHPGKLSELYCAGIRKPLFKPLSLFLILILIYLLFPVFEGLNMRLQFHMQHNYYGDFAAQKAAALAQKHGWTDTQLAEAFHLKSEKVSKFLLLLLLPFTALFFWLFTFKKRRYFFDQMVFATEVNSMYLIWGFLLLPILLYAFSFLYEVVGGNNLHIKDSVIIYFLYGWVLAFVVLGAKRFYKVSTLKAILLALLFYVAHYFIVQVIYKFLLFVTTVWLLG